MAPQLLVLALAFHRAPLRFLHLTDPAQPLPEAFGKWLAEAAKALAPGNIQASAAALDTRPEELQQAFLFFLRQTLLTPRSDHYRVLGLSRHSSEAYIKQHHGLMVRMFHPDRMPGETERNSMLTARINAAYRTLCDPQARRRYDMSLPRLAEGDQPRISSSAFFRPSEPTSKFRFFGRRRLFPSNRLRWIFAWTLAVSAFFTLVFVALKDEQPMLQINPELANGSVSDPTLQGREQQEHSGIEGEEVRGVVPDQR